MQAIYSALPGRPEFDEKKFKLGHVCPSGHEWKNTGCSLRYVKCNGRCVECGRKSALERSRKRISTPEGRKKTLEAVKRIHATRGRETRAKGLESLLVPPGQRLSIQEARIARELVASGHPLDFWTLKPLIDQQYQLECALKVVGRSPSVARLVMDEQRRYWREHPEAKREHDKQWDRDSWWLQYQINPDLRLYVRQKSKRRKALLREQTAHQIKPKQLRSRFAQFDNCCAYCGAAGDMQIEHVVPISKGGTHAIGNIVPACQTCNYSKKDHEVERWYRSQPQFSEKRWKRICRVLGWDRGSVGQLALL